jgi:hypothetical protein
MLRAAVISIVVVAAMAGCGGSQGAGTTDDGQNVTSKPSTPPSKKSGVIKLGVGVKGTFQSAKDSKTFTFVAQKGWKISGVVRSEGCGKPIPNTPACAAAFAPSAVISQGGKTLVDVKGNMQTGDAFVGFTAAEDGTYTLTASVVESDGTSGLNYLIELDPPDISCKSTSDCQVHIDGKTVETGLECAKSAFPDEDGTGTFCAVAGAEGDIPVK